MDPNTFTQNSVPIRDDSPSVPSYEISSAVESQTAVEDPPARFAIPPQDAIKSDFVTFPSFEEYEEPALPERAEVPKEPEETIKARPCQFCFANFLSWYPCQKKEKAMKGPPRSPSCCTKLISLFSRRSKRKATQEPAPSPSCSPACVRGNKGNPREEEPLLPPKPFVARQKAVQKVVTKALGCARSTLPSPISTTEITGPSHSQQFETSGEAVYSADLGPQSNMASDGRINIAGPRHMPPDMAHDSSSKHRIGCDLWHSFCDLLHGNKSSQVPTHSPPSSGTPNSIEHIAGPSHIPPEVADDNSERDFGSELLASFWSFLRNGSGIEPRGLLARRRTASH